MESLLSKDSVYHHWTTTVKPAKTPDFSNDLIHEGPYSPDEQPHLTPFEPTLDLVNHGSKKSTSNQNHAPPRDSNPVGTHLSAQHHRKLKGNKLSSVNQYPIRDRRPSTQLKDHLTFTTEISDEEELANYNEAIISKTWRRAIAEEVSSIHKNESREVTDLPYGKRPIKAKWIF